MSRSILQSGTLKTEPTVTFPRSNVFRGLPIMGSRGSAFADNSGSNLSNGTDTTTTYRYKHVALFSGTEVRLLFGNFYNGDVKGVNNITVRAGLEHPVATPQGSATVSSTMPVSFNGARGVTIEPGCWALSDPIAVDVTAGQLLYTRTNVTVASAGMKWPTSLYTYAGDQEGSTAGSDTSDSGTIATTSARGYGPVAVLGIPDSGKPVTVGGMGDSIMFGSGDSGFPNGLGYATRALTGANIGFMNLAKNTEQAAQVASSPGYKYRRNLMAACTHILEAYGRNDWGNAFTLAQVQANRIYLWTSAARRGIKVTAATNFPATTSTDGWTTAGNQTVVAGESVRTALNDWIRDGAPMLAGVAVATGSSAAGTVRTGQAGHPLIGYHELADAAETSRNSGVWKTGTIRTVTDAAISNSSSTLTSATAAFTSADVGLAVAVTGAGAGGTIMNATILGVTNSTTVSLDTNSSATVSAATAKIGQIYCYDGTHPSTYGHVTLKSAVNLGLFT
jgi:hypothetical protein